MPRMLVEPRSVRDGQLTGCTGVTMEDGTVYRANPQGHIDVDNIGHAKAMTVNPLAPGHVIEQKFHGAGTPGVLCGTCGFNGFRWQRHGSCPRCGGSFAEEGK
jgi:hypothetical protein